MDKKLQKKFAELRSISLRQQNNSELAIRRAYKKMIRELQGFIGEEYANLAQEGKLSYSILQQKGEHARFLEEVTRRLDNLTPAVTKEIQGLVAQTYELTYKGLVDAVEKGYPDLENELKSVRATTPEVIKASVNNPINKLTLSDTLEHNRQNIIYNIRKQISIGLVNGDRYEDMVKRITDSLDGDYKKAVRIVRTEAHRVREQGNNDAAVDCGKAISQGTSGLIMVKIWRTGKDARVRDTHSAMEGVTVLADEEFELPSGATAMSCGNSGVASEDINCRCYCSYKLMTVEEYEKATGKTYKEQSNKEQPKQATHETNYESYLKGYNSNELKGLALSQQVMEFTDLMKASDEEATEALVKWFKDKDEDVVAFRKKYGHLAKGDDAVKVLDSLHTINYDDVPVTLNRSSDFQKYTALTREVAEDLPDLVDDLDDVEGIYTMFRGVENNMGVKGSTINEMTKQSDYAFYGYGIFGDGIYFSTSEKGAKFYGGDIIEAKLKKDAKVITYEELRKQAPRNIADSNLSVWASMNGYDAIIEQVDRAERGEIYISVIRRSALWIKK